MNLHKSSAILHWLHHFPDRTTSPRIVGISDNITRVKNVDKIITTSGIYFRVTEFTIKIYIQMIYFSGAAELKT